MATEPRRRSERIRAQSSSQEDEARLSQVRAAITKNASFFSDVDDEVDHVGARQPTDVPEFTIGTLRKAIPAHCFERRCVLLGTALPAPPSPPLLSLAPCSLAQLASFVRIPRRRPASDRPALRVQHEDRHPRADVDTCVPGVADGARESRDVGGVLVFQGAVATGTWKIGPHVVRSLSLAFVLIRLLARSPTLARQEFGSSPTNVGIKLSRSTSL